MSSWKQWYDKARKKGYKAYKDIHKGLIILDPQGEIAYQIPVADEDYNRFTPQEILGAYYRDYGDQEPDVLGQLSDVDTTFVGDQDKPYNDEDLKNLSLEDVLAQRKGTFLSDTIPLAITQAVRHKVQRWQQSARRHGTKAPAESGRKLGPEQLKGNRYNPQQYAYGEVVNVLDFETVGTDTQKGSVLSYAVIKVAHNLDTGNWDIVDKRTRYYYPTDEDYLLTDEHGVPVYDPSIGVSGLTPENIKERRKAQLAHYGKHFTEKERISLINYLGDTPVVGHNIGQFDWPKLLGLHVPAGQQIPERFLPKGGLIDTLHLAEGTRGIGPGLNTNEMLFTLAYGMTPEQYGFTAHDALEDVQITMMVFAAMSKSQSRMGIVSRYLLHHPGLSTQFRDSMIKGFTEIRGMSKEQTDLLDAFEDAIVDKAGGETIRDYIESPLVNFDKPQVPREQALSGLGIDSSGLLPEIQELKDALSRLTANINDLSKQGSMSSATVRDAAKLSTVEERKKYIHDVLGVTGDYDTEDWSSDRTAAGYILKRANALYKARHKGQIEEKQASEGWGDFGLGHKAGQWLPPPLADVRGRPGEGLSKYTQDYTSNPDQQRYAWVNTYTRDGVSQIAGSYLSVPWYRTADFDGSKAGEGELKRFRDPLANRQWMNLPSAEDIKKTGDALTLLGQVANQTANAFESLNNTINTQAKGIYQAGSYFVPQPFKEAGGRLFQSGLTAWNSDLYARTKNIGLFGDIASLMGGTMSGAAGGFFLTGGPVGAVLGGLGGAAIGGINAWKNYKSRSLTSRGQDIISRIDLWSGISEMLIAPLRILGSSFRIATNLLGKFNHALLGTISQMSSLGIPLTNLTGMTYSDMQKSYIADTMIGKSKGTTSSNLNSFANAQMDLYSLGQLNQDRLIAAAMTGTFGSVYAYGGDTQAQYAETINTLLRKMQNADPREKQRIMTLAGKIDNTMPTTLQQLDNLAALNPAYRDYRYLQSEQWRRDRGITQYTATQKQRARYTEIGMEYTALTESISNTRYRIAARLWDAFGKNFMSGVNDVFDRLADGDWAGAYEKIKRALSGLWENVTRMLQRGGIDTSNIKQNIKAAFANLVNGAVPVLAELVAQYVKIVGQGWKLIAETTIPWIDEIISRLSMTRFDIVKDENSLTGFRLDVKTLQKSNWSEAVGAMSTDKKARKFIAGMLADTTSESGSTNFMWGEAIRNKQIKLDSASDTELNEYFKMWGPMHMRIGNDSIDIRNATELHEAVPKLYSLYEYGMKQDNNKSKRTGLAWRILTPGADVNEYGVLASSGITKSSVGTMIDKVFQDTLVPTIRELGAKVQIEVKVRDDKGNEETYTSDVKGNVSKTQSVRNSLHQLFDVTRTSVKMLQNGVQG